MTAIPLVAARADLAATIAAAVPDLPVHTAPPANVAPPCVTVGLGAGEQVNACTWEARLIVTVLSAGADNEPVSDQLDALLSAVVPAAAAWRGAAVSWQQPSQITYAGQTLYGAIIDVPKLVELGE